MKIEHDDYAFEPAELQAFDTPSVEEQLTRLLETTIKDDRRLMAAAVQAVTPDQLSKALEQMSERLKE